MPIRTQIFIILDLTLYTTQITLICTKSEALQKNLAHLQRNVNQKRKLVPKAYPGGHPRALLGPIQTRRR